MTGAPGSGPAVSIPDARHVLELEIGGMTCASCAARIEKKLNRMPGVEASVNYATERARVVLPEGTDVAAAIATVEATGYTAALPEPPAQRSPADGAGAAAPEDPETVALRQRLQISAALTIPVVALSMIPALQFTYWQWACLALASPVVVWGAWPFHRAAFVNARHGATTMDTLISIGVSAAYLYSLWALFLGGAGMTGMTMTGSLLSPTDDMVPHIYLETAAAVTVFVLLGRYLEARAKRRSGEALRALLDMGAKEVAVLRGGVEQRIAVSDLLVDEEFVVRPGREGRHRRRGRVRHLGDRRLDADRRAGAGRGRPRGRRRGRHDQRRRPPGRARHARRRRHAAGPDGPSGVRGAGGQGTRPAPGRPDLGRVRPGGHRS